MGRRHSEFEDVGTLEQRIAEAEVQLTVDELSLQELSVLDPLHDRLSMKVRLQKQTIAILQGRRTRLLQR